MFYNNKTFNYITKHTKRNHQLVTCSSVCINTLIGQNHYNVNVRLCYSETHSGTKSCMRKFLGFLITALLVHDENAGGRHVRSLSWSPCWLKEHRELHLSIAAQTESFVSRTLRASVMWKFKIDSKSCERLLFCFQETWKCEAPICWEKPWGSV